MSQKTAFLIAYDALCSKMQKEYRQINKSTENKEVIIKKIDELCRDYEREYDNLQTQFAQVEIYWSEVRKGFNIDKDRFTNLKLKLEGKLCPHCQILLIEKGLQYCYDCQKKFWIKNEKERQKEWKKKKLSHCSHCGKQTEGSRYIYDLTTKTLEPSVNNASDPDNQWLFCSETHFEKWHKKNYYCCAECIEEKYDGKYKYSKSKKDGQKFCSDNCFYKHYAEKCDECLEKCVSSYQSKATGYAKTYYRDIENKTGTLCSKCHQEHLKELSEEKRKDKEWEEACKRLDKSRDELVDAMVDAVGRDNEDNSEEEEDNDDKSNQIKSNQIKSNQIKSNQIKSNLQTFHSNSISTVELTSEGVLVVKKDNQSVQTIKEENLSPELQKLKTQMVKKNQKKLSKTDLERELARLEAEKKNLEKKNQEQKPKNRPWGLIIGGSVIGIVSLVGLVVILVRFKKNKNKKY